MNFNSKFLFAAAAAGLVTFVATAPASALSMSECSAKYKAAKSAGTLGDQKWNDFRKAQCGTDAATTPAAAPAAPAPAPAPAATAKPAAPAPAPAASGPAVFP